MDISELKVKGQPLLDRGPHQSPHQGVCLMEAVAWFAGEKHSDRPECAHPILTQIAILLNDSLEGPKRQELIELIPRLAGSARLDEHLIRAQVIELLRDRVYDLEPELNALEQKEAYELLAELQELEETHRFVGEMTELLYLLYARDYNLATELKNFLDRLLPASNPQELVAV